MVRKTKTAVFVLACVIVHASVVIAKTDTLRVMAYNVLDYGNRCQGPNGVSHNYLKTIVGYTNADIISLEKMASIPVTKDDKYGVTPYGFADSILQYALNAAYPGRYNYCPLTNAAHSSAISMLFYDQRKLGYVGVVCSYCNITDFNTYKLYYKDPELAVTHDTTFLYVIPTHDLSGDENSEVRGVQITEEMKAIKEHFAGLVNMINLGDFNARTSEEPFYKALTTNIDTDYRFYDPPFYPDHKLSYPANWDHNPAFSAYMTTSTREFADQPNPCGTKGGAKGWYDHIFLSSDIINNSNHIRYIPNSYTTVGNDGQRYQVSINDNIHVNNSAPANVVEALFQMSNKYPVMVSLEVNTGSHRIGKGHEISVSKIYYKNDASLGGFEKDKLTLHFPEDRIGQHMTLTCTNIKGDVIMTKDFEVTRHDVQIKCKLADGEYILKLTSHHNMVLEEKIVKK